MLCSGTNRHVLLLVALVFMSVCTSSHATTDTLLPNQTIQDVGQSLVSAKGNFALGFYSPGSPKNRYIAIWYHSIPLLTPVWVANRDAPIADSSGVLAFTDDGNLVITDSRGSFIQFTSISVTNNSGSSSSSMTATLTDSGNLVLSSSVKPTVVLWQSFDHPTDHFLPGMLLGMNRRTKQNRFLTSWRSFDDPSPGDFAFGANPNGTKQFFIWQQGGVYWDTGVWHGDIFSLAPEMTKTHIFNYGYTSVHGDDYFTYSLKNTSLVSRCMLDSSGQIMQLIWGDSSQAWLLYMSLPRPNCDVFNFCGNFAVCKSSACDCLEGFMPSMGTTGKSCVRKTSLQCKTDGFLPVTHVTYPIYGTILNASGADECRSACFNRCSCTAYAFSGTCQISTGELVTLKQLDADVQGKVGTVYVRIAASELQGEHQDSRKNWAFMVPVVFVLIVLVLVSCFFWRRCRGRRFDEEQAILLLGADIAKKIGPNERGSEFTVFSFSQVAEATDNFSDVNKLGEGGSGPVYKGVLAQGQEIAVKRLSTRSGQGLEEFKNEILLIAKLQHTNLVRLLGCCIQREEKILIYEYMSNKSLDFFLFDADRRAELEWARRFRIIDGIAQGLVYLHRHSRLRIIHRDLKASNILLDAEMNPKISDFGMARTFGRNETGANTMKVVGTYGYISPEYAAEGLFSIKSDVFSFGVLLLEIVSGKKNTGFHQHTNSVSLLGYAWKLWKEGKSLELMDPLLGDNCCIEEISRCIHLGLLCVQESAIDRPTMTDVITMLSSENMTLPDPKQPGFFTAREDSSSNMYGTNSVNSVTITSIGGR